MPLQLYDGENVTGSANDTIYGSDIKSTEEEPKDIKNVFLSVTVHDDDAYVIIKTDREEIAFIPVNLLPVHDDSGGTNTFQTAAQMLQAMIDYSLAIGETFKIGVKCGAQQVDLSYAYQYEYRT